MANENKTLPIAHVFGNFFHGFPKLLLTNILFAIPSAVFFGIFYLINTLTGMQSFFIQLVAVIPLFPFYAGVVSVTLYIAKGEQDVLVCKTFIANVRENFWRFLVHGVLFYVAAFFYLLFYCALLQHGRAKFCILCSDGFLYFDRHIADVFLLSGSRDDSLL